VRENGDICLSAFSSFVFVGKRVRDWQCYRLELEDSGTKQAFNQNEVGFKICVIPNSQTAIGQVRLGQVRSAFLGEI